MNSIYLFIAGFIAILAGLSIWWRYAARHRSLPCPSWLMQILETIFPGSVLRSFPPLTRLDLSAGMRVLDVGSGTGRLALPIAKEIGPEGVVISLDIQPAMLQILEKRAIENGLANIMPVLGDITRIPLDHDTFDRALLVTVLGEIPDRDSALREIFASLKPGGILSVTEIFLDPHYQSRESVRRMAEAAGFRLVRQYGSWVSFTMNFKKPDSEYKGKRNS